MGLNELLRRLNCDMAAVSFDDVISSIDEHYNFTPVGFSNGTLVNEPGQNNGSCKIFAFARQHKLSEEQTLHCFGDYYRIDVLQHPDNEDHQNIRNFMKTGWQGIRFDASPLKPKVMPG